ncbi:MAG: PFL family protein [Clostridia bacterium]|nr:PFL family protein [Clostridia bacterium]MBQ9482027.1 PFL family protein [Clostridia bacterium]
MINSKEILETVRMVDAQNLDVRTITMAVSLIDCISDDGKVCAGKVYDKISRYSANLVKVGNDIATEYGIPIVNKRVSVTPVSIVGASSGAFTEIAKALDRAAIENGIDFIGGYSALVQKGLTDAETRFLKTIPETLAATERVCSSVNVASTKAGTNMDAVKMMGEIVLDTARLTADRDSIGCAKFVVFANAVEDNPFMAGAFCGVGEGECTVNVGVSGPGVVEQAIRNIESGDAADLTAVAETVKRTAFKITRAGMLIANEAAKRLGCKFGIIDLSLAPTPTVGDSVAYVLEAMGLESVGCHGTTAALALLNDAVKKGGVMASNHVGGLSGAFIPVSEDLGMISAVERGALSLDKLEAMTCVCSVGLDMIAVPGDTPASVISAIIADECAIGVVNNKTTAVRVVPAIGKGVGDRVDFGGLLGGAPVMKTNAYSAEKFISRGGRIPAPIHSNKN